MWELEFYIINFASKLLSYNNQNRTSEILGTSSSIRQNIFCGKVLQILLKGLKLFPHVIEVTIIHFAYNSTLKNDLPKTGWHRLLNTELNRTIINITVNRSWLKVFTAFSILYVRKVFCVLSCTFYSILLPLNQPYT